MPHFDYDAAPKTGFILPETIPQGHRDNTVFKYLCSLRARGADEEQLMAAASDVNAICEPPMSENELIAKVRSVMGYDAGTSGYDGPREPTRTEEPPKLVNRHVDASVLPDLSGMTQMEQAIAYLKACYDEEDEVCITRTLDNPEDEVYHFVGTFIGLIPDIDPLAAMINVPLEQGAWITVNPMKPAVRDGVLREGRSRANVAACKNILVESDELDMDGQLERILSIFWGAPALRAIVDSGNKSYHVIVRANAKDEANYKRLASHLYRSCDYNGLPVDHACSSISRLTRIPGFMRRETGRMQRLVYAHGL